MAVFRVERNKGYTDLSSTHSIPILSPNPSPCREAATPPERKGTEAAAQSAVDIYREIIKDNIDYHILKQDMKFDSDRLDEIVDLMLETVCTARKRVRIAGDDYPAELVKSKFMKLDGEHIRFVLDCMRENTTKIILSRTSLSARPSPSVTMADFAKRIWKCTARYCSMSWCYPTSSLSIAPRLMKRHETARS